MRKIKHQIKVLKTTRSSRITFALNADLCQQAENWLNSQWTQNDFIYSSLSDLIRQSLVVYQKQKIKVNLAERDIHAPKREITIRFLDTDLLNFYYSLPIRKRTGIMEECLKKYLEKLK